MRVVRGVLPSLPHVDFVTLEGPDGSVLLLHPDADPTLRDLLLEVFAPDPSDVVDLDTYLHGIGA